MVVNELAGQLDRQLQLYDFEIFNDEVLSYLVNVGGKENVCFEYLCSYGIWTSRLRRQRMLELAGAVKENHEGADEGSPFLEHVVGLWSRILSRRISSSLAGHSWGGMPEHRRCGRA